MVRKHVVISGTGRTGTTFLVQLLTYLGLDTGFKPDDLEVHEISNAGLEHDIRRNDVPYIVKSPWFCNYAEEVVLREDIHIEHVFIPVRDLFSAAESRRQVTRKALVKSTLKQRIRHFFQPRVAVPGGVYAANPGHQELVLLEQFYKLSLALSRTFIPITLLNFPEIIQNSRFLYEKLKPILGQTDFGSFNEIFKSTVRPELVHTFDRKIIRT
ncbi:MAG: hypothetical protein OXH16_22400 [Gemmatimonadetes bacterium]|nr:hypothetical protein [Gemmatimonadota bacterium]